MWPGISFMNELPVIARKSAPISKKTVSVLDLTADRPASSIQHRLWGLLLPEGRGGPDPSASKLRLSDYHPGRGRSRQQDAKGLVRRQDSVPLQWEHPGIALRRVGAQFQAPHGRHTGSPSVNHFAPPAGMREYDLRL